MARRDQATEAYGSLMKQLRACMFFPPDIH